MFEEAIYNYITKKIGFQMQLICKCQQHLYADGILSLYPFFLRAKLVFVIVDSI